MKDLKEIKLEELVTINGGTDGVYQPPKEVNPLDPPSNSGPIIVIDVILY